MFTVRQSVAPGLQGCYPVPRYIIMTIFQDLLNFDDPLNLEAAEHYQRDKVSETLALYGCQTGYLSMGTSNLTCQLRGIQVVATTQMTGIFRVLEKPYSVDNYGLLIATQ